MKHHAGCNTNRGEEFKCDCPAKDTIQVSQTPPENDSVMACIRCGSMRDVNLVAHRNEGENLVGMIVVCFDCMPEMTSKSIRLEVKC